MGKLGGALHGLVVIGAFACGGASHDKGTSNTDGGNRATPDLESAGSGAGGETYGMTYSGGVFNLGPVDYQESQFHNACAPQGGYDARVQKVEGTLLAGLWNGIPNVANNCDACISVTTKVGKTALLRVVTYGDTSANSIDVSPEAYAILDSNEYPRAMTWQFARCDEASPIMYEFQTMASEYWTSLWVRNAAAPLAKVEVQSVNHASYVELQRGTDGTLTDGSGFGKGAFSLRLTTIDGKTLVENFEWPAAGIAGQFITGKANVP